MKRLLTTWWGIAGCAIFLAGVVWDLELLGVAVACFLIASGRTMDDHA
jgi:hypothetical protein